MENDPLQQGSEDQTKLQLIASLVVVFISIQFSSHNAKFVGKVEQILRLVFLPSCRGVQNFGDLIFVVSEGQRL